MVANAGSDVGTETVAFKAPTGIVAVSTKCEPVFVHSTSSGPAAVTSLAEADPGAVAVEAIWGATYTLSYAGPDGPSAKKAVGIHARACR